MFSIVFSIRNILRKYRFFFFCFGEYRLRVNNFWADFFEFFCRRFVFLIEVFLRVYFVFFCFRLC